MSGALAMMLASADSGFVQVGVSAVAASSSASLVIDKPSGVQAGDLLVAIISGGAAITWTGDTGWTEELDASRLRVAVKLATGSEGSTFTFTASGSTFSAGVIIAYRSAAFDVVGSVGTATSGSDVVAPGVTLSSLGILLAAFGIDAPGRTMTTPTGMLPVVVYPGAAKPSLAIFSQQLGAGATGTRTSSPGGGGSTSGVLIGIKGA